MEVLRIPHPSLFTPCKEVTSFGPELKVLLESMWETMLKSHGRGLAANQVNLPYRMFVMRGPEEEKLFIINPKIVVESNIPANLAEGCLSSPGEFLILGERSDKVQIIYQDENGDVHSGTFEGIHAVCVQHEIQHLNGESYLQSPSLSRQLRRSLARKWGLR